MLFQKILFFLAIATFLSSCNSSPDAKKNNPSKEDSVVQLEIKKEYNYQFNYGTKPGLVGVFEVPEMLSLCIMDSARLQNMPGRVEEDYRFLEQDLKDLKISASTSGQIVYRNDTSNFKFECFQLLKSMPSVQPKKSKVVVLEAEQMLVYNFYGKYINLPSAYFEILDYVKTNKIKQAGPFREYYVTNPLLEKDPGKWLTVIMLPVRK